MSAAHFGKEVFSEGAPIADARTEAHAAMIVAALNGCPLQSFERARAIGERLHDRWHTMSQGEAPFAPDDMAWGDIVQFVVRLAMDPAPLVRKRQDEPAPEPVPVYYNQGAAE